MKVVFGNKKELVYLNALETEEFYNGSSRRTMTFTCDPAAMHVDELNEILNDVNNIQTLECHGSFTAQNPDGSTQEVPVTNYYDGYNMKLKVGIEQVLIQNETPETAAVYEDRLVFKLGRPTFIESQLQALGIKTN